jgi:acetolactate synthase-1/3 small subunit
MKRTLVALMQDQPGVLNRVASLFRRRGFNIESLAVGHTETEGVSRMTLVVDEAHTSVEQVTLQLNRLIEVLEVSDVTDDPNVARELVLLKVDAPASRRPDLQNLVTEFDARIADVGADTLLLELAAEPEHVDNFVSAARPFGIREMVRTGRITMVRGAQTHTADAYVRVA